MKTKLLVEIGENHLGNWQLAKGLVREAAKAGGTHAKFQTYTAEQFGKDHRWYEDFKKVEISEEMHFELQEECKHAGIEFLSSSFTQQSTGFLVDKMGLTELKIASGRIPHLELLKDMADSIPKCNAGQSIEDLQRCAVVKALTRSIVEHCLCSCNLVMTHAPHVDAFGEIITE